MASTTDKESKKRRHQLYGLHVEMRQKMGRKSLPRREFNAQMAAALADRTAVDGTVDDGDLRAALLEVTR